MLRCTIALKPRQRVEKVAQNVLDARAKFTNASLADLYDPNTMPQELVEAHQVPDKAIDLCYRPQPFRVSNNKTNIGKYFITSYYFR